MRPGREVLAVGETMTLVAPTAPLAIAAGTRYALRAGGAESNVAVHLARLGHTSAWAGLLGDDALGRLVVSELDRAGVDTSGARCASGFPTGLYLKQVEDGKTSVLYYRRGSAASTMGPDFLRTLRGGAPRVAHLTGITAALSDSCLALLRCALLERELEAEVVSFDVNHRPQLWPSPREAAPVLLELAQAADVVFVGLDEAAHLWGTRTPADVRRLLCRPGSLVVKDGAVGATAWEGDRTWFVPAPPVDVVEVVGAGDAFAAGWLAGHLRGLDAEDRLELGHLVAGHVLLTTSDDAQFPPSLHRTLAVQGKG